MKRTLGGIVCLVLPALALAQDGGGSEVPDVLVAEDPVTIVQQQENLASLPLGAARFVGEPRPGEPLQLLLAGGLDPRRGASSILAWNELERRWQSTGRDLPADFDTSHPVGATWVSGDVTGLLFLGTSTRVGQPRSELYLEDMATTLSTTDPCEPLPGQVGAVRFLEKAVDDLGTPHTLLVYLQAGSGAAGDFAGQLYGLTLTPGAGGRPPVACFERLLANLTFPEEHVFGGVAFDPDADNGAGALVFAGGYQVVAGGPTLRTPILTAVLTTGERVVDDIGGSEAYHDVLPLPGQEGVLVLVESDNFTTPQLRHRFWSETSRQYLESVPFRPPIIVGPELLPGQVIPFEAGPRQFAHLPGGRGTVIDALVEGTSLSAGGFSSTVTAAAQTTTVLYSEVTARLFGEVDVPTLWPQGRARGFRFRLTLDGRPTSGWQITPWDPPGADATRLTGEVIDPVLPAEGIFEVELSAEAAGTSTLTLGFDQDGRPPFFAPEIPVQIDERESIYSREGCSSSGGEAGLAFALTLFGLLLSVGRRRTGLLALTVALLLPLPTRAAEEQAADRPKLAFLGVTPGAGVDEATAEAISDYIQTLAAGTKGYQLIRLTEVKEMLGFEAQRQLLGCADEGCMTDVAGSLEVDRLLRASVSRLGESMMVQITLLDGAEATQLGASGMRLEKTQDAEAVLDVLPEILNEIFATDPRFEGKKVKHRSLNVRSRKRERRWSFGIGADIDLTNGGGTLFGAHIGYRSRILGFGLGLLPRMGRTPVDGKPVPLGMRAELRLRLFRAGPVHPHLGAGVTYFPQDTPLGRVALHTEIDFHRFVRGFVAVAGEAMIVDQPFNQFYLLLNVGVAFTP